MSSVLRRVEAGERLRVTVSGRSVAELVPLSARPGSMAREEFARLLAGGRADAGLAEELAELRLGVLAAADGPTRARRLETLLRVDALDPIPVVTRDADDDVPDLRVLRL